MTKNFSKKEDFYSIRELRNIRGFTMIELIVTVAVFSMTAVLIVSIFARAMSVQRRATSAEKLQANGTFIIESIAKEIRVSNIENQDSANCTATSLSMTHPYQGTTTYSLINGNVYKSITIPATFNSIVNSTEVTITRLNFCITGSGLADNQPPKVTILIALENSFGQILHFDFQTTVVSRDITSELQN
jgi:prepilin-type N-terminal cleavage/methylation domain-containing protein